MTFREGAGLLRGMALSYGLRMPNLDTMVEEAPDGSFRLCDGISLRDCRLLRIRLRLVLEALSDRQSHGASVEKLRARMEERELFFRIRLAGELGALYRQIRPVEAQWRGIEALFLEAGAGGQGPSVWIWNGKGDGWREDARMPAPTVVVTPGVQRPPGRHGEWRGPFPEPIVFGDRPLEEIEAEYQALASLASGSSDPEARGPMIWSGPSMRTETRTDARSDRTALSAHSRTGALGVISPQDQSLAPSRFALCTNQIQGRSAYPWEDEPLWVEASWYVAGVHLRLLRNAEWGAPGSGPLSGRLLSARRAKERLAVSRAERLRDCGWIPVGWDDAGCMALGDSTRPLSGCRSTGLAALRLEAATSRWMADRMRRRLREATPERMFDPLGHAGYLLTIMEERRFVQSYSVSLESGRNGGRVLRIRLVIDDSEVSMAVDLPGKAAPIEAAGSRNESAQIAGEHVEAEAGREPAGARRVSPAAQTESDVKPGPALVPTREASPVESAEQRPQGLAAVLRGFLGRFLSQPGRKTRGGDPTDRQ